MTIRRFRAAVLATALSAAVLTGAAPTSATVLTSAAPTMRVDPQGPYTTTTECQSRQTYASTHGYFGYVSPCFHYYGPGGPQSAPDGYYFLLAY
ncbi:hypothetical protein AB0395_45205 [Streptosporangium sp. NPDC051023]|uniref:hypothetical protein n=1 Tax=Streptosporangium sp. NPDC051023 TaxID=3155410 RepID=UPI003450F91D